MENNISKETINKKTPAIVIVALLICALLIACIVLLFTIVFKSPKQRVMLAISRTLGSSSIIAELSGNTRIKTDFYDQSLLSYNELMNIRDSIASNNYETSSNYKIVDFSYGDENIALIRGLAFSSTTYMDLENRRAYGDYRVKYNGFKLLGVRAYVEDNILSLSEKKLLDGCIQVNTETLGKDFMKSDLARLLEIDTNNSSYSDISFNFFELSKEIPDTEGLTHDLTSNKKEIIEPIYNLYNAIEVEDIKEERIFVIDGKDVSCDTYAITIPSSAIEDFVEDYEPYLQDYLNDNMDSIKEYFSNIEDSEDFYITFDNKEYSLDESDELVSDVCDALIDEISDFDDLTVYVYIDGKNRLLGFDTEYALGSSTDDDTLLIKVEYSFTGSEYLADNIDGSIIFENLDRDESIEFDYSCESTIKDDIKETDIYFSCYSIDDTVLDYVATQTYDNENNYFTYNGCFDLNDPENTSFEIFAEGSIDYTSESLSIELDHAGLDVKDNSGNARFDFNITYYISALTNDIPYPDEPTYKIFKMSEEELMELSEEIYKGVKSNPLGSLF